MSPERPASMIVEVMLLSDLYGCLHYRQVAHPLPAGVHPDDLARRLSGLRARTSGAVLHSTSWRYTGGSVVLTYAALPDPAPADGAAPVLLDAAAYGGPLAPSPACVDVDAVATHACRHLALLVHTDAEVAAVAKAQPQLWELFSKLAPGTPGGLHAVSLTEEPV